MSEGSNIAASTAELYFAKRVCTKTEIMILHRLLCQGIWGMCATSQRMRCGLAQLQQRTVQALGSNVLTEIQDLIHTNHLCKDNDRQNVSGNPTPPYHLNIRLYVVGQVRLEVKCITTPYN